MRSPLRREQLWYPFALCLQCKYLQRQKERVGALRRDDPRQPLSYDVGGKFGAVRVLLSFVANSSQSWDLALDCMLPSKAKWQPLG